MNITSDCGKQERWDIDSFFPFCQLSAWRAFYKNGVKSAASKLDSTRTIFVFYSGFKQMLTLKRREGVVSRCELTSMEGNTKCLIYSKWVRGMSLFSKTSHFHSVSPHLLTVKQKPLILTRVEHTCSALSRLFFTRLHQVTHIYKGGLL